MNTTKRINRAYGLLAMIMIGVFFLALPGKAYADLINTDIEYFDDGSYGITTYENNLSSILSVGTVSQTKNYTYYDSNNNKQWKISLSGSFSYTGSSASCTSASVSYTIYNSNWKVTKAQASKSGRTATGEFTVKKYVLGVPIKTVNKTLTLTCSNSGNVT